MSTREFDQWLRRRRRNDCIHLAIVCLIWIALLPAGVAVALWEG